MKKLLWSLPVRVLAAVLVRAEHGEHKGKKGGCPGQIAGAEVVVENSADGVIVRISAKDPAVVTQIQEKAAEHFKKKDGKCPGCKGDKKCPKCAGKGKKGEMKAKYVCPMKDGGMGDKPGKCPKCGMDMKKAVPAEKKK